MESLRLSMYRCIKTNTQKETPLPIKNRCWEPHTSKFGRIAWVSMISNNRASTLVALVVRRISLPFTNRALIVYNNCSYHRVNPHVSLT